MIALTVSWSSFSYSANSDDAGLMTFFPINQPEHLSLIEIRSDLLDTSDFDRLVEADLRVVMVYSCVRKDEFATAEIVFAGCVIGLAIDLGRDLF